MLVRNFFIVVALLMQVFTASPALRAAGAPAIDEIERLRAILAAPPPDPKENSKAALSKIYLERGRAAGTLGDNERELQELKVGIEVLGAKDPNSYELHDRLARLEFDRGDFVAGRAARQAALAVAGTLGRRFFQLVNLASTSAVLRDRESAKAYLSQADGTHSSMRRANPDWSRFGDLWNAALSDAKGNYNFSFGYILEAETHYRTCATAMRTYLGKNPDASDNVYYYLPQCLSRWVELAARVGHLREATAYVSDVRDTAKAYAQKQQRSLFATRMSRSVARVYLEQGLIDEARALLESTISQAQKFQRGEAALQVEDARLFLALIEMTQGNWSKADEYFRARREGQRANKDQSKQRDSENTPEWGYTLLRLGKTDEAIAVLNADLGAKTKQYDEQSLFLWESRAFHALGVATSGDREAAAKTLAVAVPKILEMGRGQGSTETGWLSSIRLGWILDGYIAILAELHRAGVRPAGTEPYAEAFRIADIARSSRVQKALSAAILRASVNDPELAAVIRRAQDLDYQVKAVSEGLTALQAIKPEKPDPNREKLIEKTRLELERVREENAKAQAELKRKLPDYSELLDAKPVTVTDAQKLLKPQEAVISIYSTQKQTLVWAVPAQGQVAFAVADLPLSTLSEMVTKLRKSLDPSEADIGEVPTFDFNTAYELYQKLLRPVEAGWKNAKELIIVPHGSLSELPFSVLVTEAFKPNRAGIPFADHAAAPWLLKSVSISYLPALSALTSLRRTTTTQQAARSFIGFGDPLFGSSAAAPVTLAARGMARRNSKVPAAPSRPSSNLELLQPLPDTAAEVHDIAKILGADENRDVFLGRRASEQQVKSADLANYRVVMFATHGLVPGELPDLTQPALALSNPMVTGERDDGLLTLAEILGLKLKADWVVLSACNTASPDGQASEAVSGLGRAFFFAGAKALLVSHWPVETVSAKLLTTELFKRQAADTKLNRAQALRDASLEVMQQLANPDRGQPYSYAHPMFWAPFVVVGDGG
jgi:CHAT domain-containing protein